MTWIDDLLQRNAHTAYLRHYGSPRRLDELPVVTYDDLRPWLERIRDGEPDVLFAGRPVAYERTSGSTGASKLIPYSMEGLHDIRRAVEPWITRVMSGITGSVYLALSPATRAPEFINGIPVGLPESAYVGAFKSTVPPEVAFIEDVEQWRAETVRHLAAARDLELISVWSPTFLLRLLDEFDFDWPNLKIISCWASGASKPYAEELARRFPRARIEPKGLMSTECIVTVPGVGLNPHGHFEFDHGEVIATTASGLYRYRTGDYVDERFEFIGRGNLVSDLVGEKLAEPFVSSCLEPVAGFRYLAPDGDGYVLHTETHIDVDQIEQRLCENPQYAYARKLGQLRPLRLNTLDHLYDRYVDAQLARGARLGDIKPVALVTS